MDSVTQTIVNYIEQTDVTNREDLLSVARIAFLDYLASLAPAENEQAVQDLVKERLLETRNAFYIGRHLDYYVAMEAALKLKEISYVQTESFAAGELKHGTIALIEEGTPVIALLSEPVVASHTRGNIQEVKARGAVVTTIAMEGVEQEGDDIIVPAVPILLAPIVSVVVTQLIAYYTSLGKGLDVDKPRNLAKSVTVE